MDKSISSGSSNTAIRSKKLPFSSAEKELIIELVRERPIIEDKRTHGKNIELKKQAWEDLAISYNSQPYVSQRVSHQLKRCWENIKTQRKKELSQESMSLKRTGGGPPESGSIVSDNVVDTICPFINLRVPGVVDSNTIEILDTMNNDPHYEENTQLLDENATVKGEIKKRQHESEYENVTTKGRKKFLSEAEGRVKRTQLNIEHDKELHELRIKRERILIAREENLLEFEQKYQELQIKKINCEIQLLTKQV